MIKTKFFAAKERILAAAAITAIAFTSNIVAASWTSWHPIVAVGLGAAMSSNLGDSQTFPIQNPNTDEFYIYSANHANQSSLLFNGFVGAEWNPWTNWLFDAGLAFNQSTPFLAKGQFVQGVDFASANTYSYQYGVLTRQLLLESKLLYTLKERFHPYVLLALGAAFNKAYHYSTNVPPFSTFTRAYSNNSVSSFSYALGLGIDMNVNNKLRVGVGYRFIDLGKVKLGSSTIDTVSVSGTLSQSSLYANELLGQLIWIFE